MIIAKRRMRSRTALIVAIFILNLPFTVADVAADVTGVVAAPPSVGVGGVQVFFLGPQFPSERLDASIDLRIVSLVFRAGVYGGLVAAIRGKERCFLQGDQKKRLVSW